MTLRERFSRLVSRKSLYSSGSSTSQNSSSSASSTNESRAGLSSGATTPLPVPISTSTPHPLAPILNPSSPTSSSQRSPTSDSAPKGSPSLLSKSLTWRSSHGHNSGSWSWGGKERRERKKAASENKAHGAVAGAGGKAQLPKRRLHPSERPLTEANLRQQEALSQFKWEFGRKGGPGSLGGWSVESGISPCGSRRSSYDLTVHEMPLPPAAPTPEQ